MKLVCLHNLCMNRATFNQESLDRVLWISTTHGKHSITEEISFDQVKKSFTEKMKHRHIKLFSAAGMGSSNQKQKSSGDKIQLLHCIGEMDFFMSYFLCFCRYSSNEGICLPFNSEPFIIWKCSESIWTRIWRHRWAGITNQQAEMINST